MQLHAALGIVEVHPTISVCVLQLDAGLARDVFRLNPFDASADLFADSVICVVAANLKAGGEVVLAAGAVHSPFLLKLSGIGPREELEHHGIHVVADLPAVGENLQVPPPPSLQSARIAQPTDRCIIRRL